MPLKPEDIDAAMELLAQDAVSTLVDEVATIDARLLRLAATVADYADEPGWFARKLVDDFQQEMHDEFVDITWPACPRHPWHPLWLSDTPPFVWRCVTDRVVVGPLGSLRA